MIRPSESPNENLNQQLSLEFPSLHNRMIRTTKFPRIGRSSIDSEDFMPLFNQDSAIDADDGEENANLRTLHWLNERSVLFPRIGKRAFNPFFETSTLFQPWHGFYGSYGEFPMANENRAVRRRREKSSISM